MARAIAHPMAYPMAHPKFCNFTNYKEKITIYLCRDQELEIRAIAAIFLSNSPQGVLGLIRGLGPAQDVILYPGDRDP